MKREFKKAKSIAEISLVARKLREEGKDINDINKLAHERKRELVAKASKVNNLQFVIPRASAKATNKVTHIGLRSYMQVSRDTLIVHEDYSIEL